MHVFVTGAQDGLIISVSSNDITYTQDKHTIHR